MCLEGGHWCSFGSFLPSFSASVFYSRFWFLVVKIQMWQRQWWASTTCVSWITAVVVWSDPILPLVTLWPCLKIAPSADSFGDVSGAKEYPPNMWPLHPPYQTSCQVLISCIQFLSAWNTWFWWVLSWILTVYKKRWGWAELRGPLQWSGS